MIDEAIWGDQSSDGRSPGPRTPSRTSIRARWPVSGSETIARSDSWSRPAAMSPMKTVVELAERYFGGLAPGRDGRCPRSRPTSPAGGRPDPPRRARYRAGAPLHRHAGAALLDRATIRAGHDRGDSLLRNVARVSSRRSARSGDWSTRSTATSGRTRMSARAWSMPAPISSASRRRSGRSRRARKLRDEGVPEDELQRTKDLRKGRLLMGLGGQPLGRLLDRQPGVDLRRDQDTGRGDGEDRRGHRARGQGACRRALPDRQAQPRA